METLSDLMVRAQTETLYVRWETDGTKGIQRGYSVNHVSGAREAGLSANSLMTDGLEWLAVSVLEYRGVCGLDGWIVGGEEIGRGSDNEPILANVRVVAPVTEAMVAEAEAIVVARNERRDAERAARVTFKPAASYGSCR
jgi:hypothetical protein